MITCHFDHPNSFITSCAPVLDLQMRKATHPSIALITPDSQLAEMTKVILAIYITSGIIAYLRAHRCECEKLRGFENEDKSFKKLNPLMEPYARDIAFATLIPLMLPLAGVCTVIQSLFSKVFGPVRLNVPSKKEYLSLLERDATDNLEGGSEAKRVGSAERLEIVSDEQKSQLKQKLLIAYDLIKEIEQLMSARFTFSKFSSDGTFLEQINCLGTFDSDAKNYISLADQLYDTAYFELIANGSWTKTTDMEKTLGIDENKAQKILKLVSRLRNELSLIYAALIQKKLNALKSNNDDGFDADRLSASTQSSQISSNFRTIDKITDLTIQAALSLSLLRAHLASEKRLWQSNRLFYSPIYDIERMIGTCFEKNQEFAAAVKELCLDEARQNLALNNTGLAVTLLWSLGSLIRTSKLNAREAAWMGSFVKRQQTDSSEAIATYHSDDQSVDKPTKATDSSPQVADTSDDEVDALLYRAAKDYARKGKILDAIRIVKPMADAQEKMNVLASLAGESKRVPKGSEKDLDADVDDKTRIAADSASSSDNGST